MIPKTKYVLKLPSIAMIIAMNISIFLFCFWILIHCIEQSNEENKLEMNVTGTSSRSTQSANVSTKENHNSSQTNTDDLKVAGKQNKEFFAKFG